MADNKIKEEINNLIAMGNRIFYAGVYSMQKVELNEESEKRLKEISKEIGDYKKAYHVWYLRAYRCIRNFAPERLDEFEEFYTGQKNLKKLDYLSAGITHYFQGIVTHRT